MAAPSQTSPHQASEKVAAAPKSDEAVPNVAAAAAPESPAAAPVAPSAAPQDLTYQGTESSDTFLLAKRLLSDGDFDNAIETIGTALGSVMSQLPEDEADVHEALAPLYYLYGTTLLYSIEESSDNLQAPALEEGEADDSQIAWENLEAARHIIDKMMLKKQIEDKLSNKLSLDLAQIHLRLGDLQKANGRYHDAISDYSKCLELRQPILGAYDRKVADTHYNLGLVYMSLGVSSKQQQQQEAAPQQPAIPPQLFEEYRRKALTHYLAGGKAFAGQIAFLCSASPEEITSDENVKVVGGGKTTGMDEAELAASAISCTLKAIRARVAPLKGEDEATIFDLKEILDEIQETIDEAESAKQAIEEVSELKAQAQAAAEGDGEVTNMDGSTTTIGFGAPAPAAAAAPATMMVVRKKKKRSEEEDSKMPADDTKRAKTE